MAREIVVPWKPGIGDDDDDWDAPPQPKSLDELVATLLQFQRLLPERWHVTPNEDKPRLAEKIICDLHKLGDQGPVGEALAAIAWRQGETARPDGTAPLERTFLRIIVKLDFRRASAVAAAVGIATRSLGAVKKRGRIAQKIKKKGGFDSMAYPSAKARAKVQRKAAKTKTSSAGVVKKTRR